MLTEGLLFADRYELIKQLGRGGFSEVWLARDTKAGVVVAVKIYAPGTGLDDAGIELFTKEFSLVFDMNHTNLLRPTYFDYSERMPYLILPYCKNGSAFKYITSSTPIPEHEAWKLLHDVAAGLAYLHEKTPPIIHQDIKPDNILIGDEGQYMITDFGISARVRSTMRKNQGTEQSGGTLAYMGPERFSSNPKPIMASDIWSLGAMMYELMSHDMMPPFGNHGGVLQKNGAEIPILEGAYSQELKDTVYRCLASEPWERPSARAITEYTYSWMHGLKSPAPWAAQQAEPQALAQTQATERAEEPTKQPKPTNDSEPAYRPSHSEPANSPQNNEPRISSPSPYDLAPASSWKDKAQALWAQRNVRIGVLCGGALLLLLIVFMCLPSGSEDTEAIAPEPVVVTLPPEHYDSLMNEDYQRAIELRAQGDSIRELNDWADERFLVEEKYIGAFETFDALRHSPYADSISTSLRDNISMHQTNVGMVLNDIYNTFASLAEKLQSINGEAADRLRIRKGRIDEALSNSDWKRPTEDDNVPSDAAADTLSNTNNDV